MSWQRIVWFGRRLIVTVIGTAVVLAVSLRAYVAYEIHRATSLLEEASRAQVGDDETAVLPMVKQYRGFRWAPNSLGAKEDWIEKEEYDYHKEIASDYRYDLEVSPLNLIPSDLEWDQHRITQAIRTATRYTPLRLRAALGMRDWGTDVGFAIRGSRIQSVEVMVLVEGRTRWHEYERKFVSAMPERRMQGKAFIVESGSLEMGDKGGDVVQNLFTPRASNEEIALSRKFNAACFTSLRGCKGFCELIPRTLEYLKQHPDAAGSFDPPKCP